MIISNRIAANNFMNVAIKKTTNTCYAVTYRSHTDMSKTRGDTMSLNHLW